MSDLAKIIFYVSLIIPVLSFLFCFLMANEFDFKEALFSSIHLNFILYVLLNTASLIFIQNIGISVLIYILLFTGAHYWNKYAKTIGQGWNDR